MPATHEPDSTLVPTPTLYLAFELGWTTWNLAFTTGMGRKPRMRFIPARNLVLLTLEIQRAKQRFSLPDDSLIISCYEAGRDGFWLHRWLTHQAIHDHVVDAASIEVNRRARRAKSDSIDVTKLLSLLIRYRSGERDLWSVVNPPTPDDEDRRQPQRELMALQRERTEHSNRIKGLLANLGLDILVDERLIKRLDLLRQWDDRPVPTELRERIIREFERWKLVDAQLRRLQNQQRRRVRDDAAIDVEKIRMLLDLRGIGPVGSWMLVREIFGWRKIKNRRELASLVGLTPTPYQSGVSHREQRISKAGNRRVRWLLVELAWMWLRYQPNSALSQWYRRRFGSGNARARKVGIVALARKLLIALWKYVERGEVPEGAEFVPWQKKLNGRMPATKRTA